MPPGYGPRQGPRPPAPPPVQFPAELPMSEKVTATVGYKSDRLRIGVKTGIPFVGEIGLWLGPEDLPKVERVLAVWRAWLTLPAPRRFLEGKDDGA
jgi:hypothetical protein